ncbi:MAG: phage tail tape measure protein [Candidatus Tenebribacter davisii]|nr:phage tail tape measure protein [Candidatus Tenebribacter davisii]
MADNVKKQVEIVFKVIGVDLDNVDKLSIMFKNLQTVVDETTAKVNTFNESLKNIKAPPELSAVITPLKELSKIKLPSVDKVVEGLQKLVAMGTPPDLKPFVTELSKFNEIKLPKLTSMVTAIKNLVSISFQGFSGRINIVRRNLRKLAAINVDSLASVLKNLNKINLSKVTAGLKRAEKSIRDVGNTAQTAGLKLRSFADKARTVLTFRVISNAIVAFNQAMFAGRDAIIEYDQALKDLQAITGATAFEVAQMGAEILKVAATTKFSASEVAAGMRTIGQAGFSASEAVETMQAVSDLATGTLSSMGTTVDLVTTAMRIYQISAADSAIVSDVFANAVNRSKLTIDKLRTAMNYVGPIAKESGVSFKELSASMMVLANSGLRASTTGTGLRRVFAELVDPSKKLMEAARNAGIALNELDPTSNSLSSVISNLGLIVKDTGVAFDIFGKRGAAAVITLSNTGSGFDQMLETVNRTGTAARMAAVQMEGLGVAAKNLRDRMGVLAIAVGEMGVTDAMRVLISVTKVVIESLTYLANNTFVKFTSKIILATAAVFGLVAAFTALKSLLLLKFIPIAIFQMTGLAISVVTVKTAMLSLLATIAPIAAALAVIGGVAYFAFSQFKNSAEEASEATAVLAIELNGLTKKVKSYRLATVNMVKGSNELKESSLTLRRELLEVSRGTTEVADEALAAAEAIDPLTGEITDASEALDIYAESLKKVQNAQFVKSLEEAGEAVQFVTGKTNTFKTGFVNIFSSIKKAGKAAFKALNAKLISDPANTAAMVWNRTMTGIITDAEKAKAALNFSAAFNEGKKSFQELADEVGSYDPGAMVAQQVSLKESFIFLKARASEYVDQLRVAGTISLDGSVEGFENIATKAGLTGTALEAATAEFIRLSTAAESTFDNIIEKQIRANDPEFITKYVDEFVKAHGKISDAQIDELKAAEELRQQRIEDFKQLKINYDKAKAENQDMTEFSKGQYVKEKELLLLAGEDRKTLSELEIAQMVLSFGKEMEIRNARLAQLSVIYEKGYTLDRQRAKYLFESDQRIQAILDGEPIGSERKNQNQLYKNELKEREAAHALSLANIKKQQAAHDITDQAALEKKQKENIAFYAKSVEMAKRHLASGDSEAVDPKEYRKRYNLVLEAQKKLNVQEGRSAIELADMKDDLKEAEFDKAETISSAIYEAAQKKQEEARKTLNLTLKAAYDADTSTRTAYFAKQRDLAEKATRKESDDIAKRSKAREAEFNDQIDAENDAAKKLDLQAELKVYLIEVEAELNTVREEGRQTIIKYTSAEEKANTAADKSITRVLDKIKKSRDNALKAVPGTSVEDQMKLDLDAMKRGHAAQLAELKDKGLKGLALQKAIADQSEEVHLTEVTNKKKLDDLLLEQKVEFAGSMTSIMEGLLSTSLGQNEKFFKAYKAFAIAEATISTYASAQAAYEKGMLIKGPMGYALAIAGAAAAIAQGLGKIAIISGTAPSFADGGEIPGSSPHSKSDNIPINATAGEYMQPVSAVKKYGKRAMNAIRTLQIPADELNNLIRGTARGLMTPFPSYALASGGSVPSMSNTGSTGETIVNLHTPQGVPMEITSQSSRLNKDEKKVIDIVLKYTSNNTNNFKNNMKGMLGA